MTRKQLAQKKVTCNTAWPRKYTWKELGLGRSV